MTLQATLHQARLAALARRAAAQPEAVQALLQARLQQLGTTPANPPLPAPAATPAAASPSPLATLLAELAEITDSRDPAPAGHGADTRPPRGMAGGPGPAHTPAPRSHRELKAVRDYRSTWSRLAVEQRLHQALASVPSNAGPLNTQRLVHQALHTLNRLSPEYLQRLVVQVEALLWLEQLGPAPAPGPGSERKATPTRGTTPRTERRRAG